MATLTTRGSNPAAALRRSYATLMALECVETLRTEAEAVVRACRGLGLSEANWKKFQRIIATKRSLFDVRKYVTDYLLAADGLAVIASRS